jgi:hypothetical protein
MRNDILDKKQDILIWITENRPKAYICKILKCKPETLERYLQIMGITYVGNQGSRGSKNDKTYISASEYIKNNYVSAHKLKLKLIREGIKEHRCEVCNISEWMSQKVPIELDHIDGNHYNNDMKNLRIICPNCHAQTSTNSGKNNKKRI